jgi:16S rRNA pseudouridine516 synthase
MTKPAKLEISEDRRKVFISICEGKFHQVKRMCSYVGKNVVFLKRISMGDLILDDTLAPGECRELTQEELKKIM